MRLEPHWEAACAYSVGHRNAQGEEPADAADKASGPKASGYAQLETSAFGLEGTYDGLAHLLYHLMDCAPLSASLDYLQPYLASYF